MALTSAAIKYEVASRGVVVSPQPIGLSAPQLLAIGDSITFGAGTATPATMSWPANLTLTNNPGYIITNGGISGIPLLAITGSEPNRYAPYCQTTSGPSNAVVFAGTNDFGQISGVTPALVMASLAGEIQTLKTAGCRVYVGTMISRGGTDVGGVNTYDTDKDGYDALILQQARQDGADGIIDFAANPLMGADGANANTTYFQADKTHPTAAGQLLLAAAASNVLNYANGYNDLNQHVVTSLPYSMTAADGYISLAGLTGAGTLTLPDCTGQSGALYRVNNPQSTYAVSVKTGNANQLINGLAAATTVTVPANGMLTLRDVPNPKSVSGCHWEM